MTGQTPTIFQLAPGAFTTDHLLTAAECREWIERTEAMGYAAAPVSTAAGPVMMPNIRNNARVMFDDPEDAKRLFDRLRAVIPPTWQSVQLGQDAWECVGLNERLRFYRYTPGQSFAMHRDGHFMRSDAERSLLTLLIYLNAPLAGGATNIVTQGEVSSVEPRPGRALFFAHRLLHEGEAVTEGVKYVLRSDVMYRKT